MKPTTYKLTAQVETKDEHELVIALKEVIRSIEAGNTSGFDRSSTGRYAFEITTHPPE